MRTLSVCSVFISSRRTWEARALLSVATLLLLLAPAPVRSQEIWFGPRTPDYAVTAVRDWATLFKPNPEWEQLAGQIHVFFAAPGFFLVTPDDQLKAMAADLASHHIELGMPLGALIQRPGEACANHEGYAAPWVIPKVVDKMKRDGVRLRLLRIDGPLWYGHYDGGGCKLPVSQLAPRVMETLQPLLQAFPDIEVGDVEGAQGLSQFPDWQANFLEYKRELEAAMGRKLTFVHVDTNWQQPNWPTAIAAMAKLAHGAGMKFGVIYDGNGFAPTDEAWVAEAKRAFDELETRYGLIPDQAVFQTWTERPTHVFPETSDAAHSYLIAQYLLPRTHLVVQRTATGLEGRLTQANGQPVAGARIAIEVLGDDPNAPPPVRTASGTVPSQARFAVLGLRVNTECSCSGPNDLLLGTLSYRETSGGSVHYVYRYAPPPRPQAGVAMAPELVADQPLVHLQVPRRESVGFNSPVFAVTPAAQFQFQVPLASLNGRGMFGTATVIWMNAQRHGFKRENILVGSDAAPLADATTDASGRFAMTLPENANWRQRALLLHYAGSPTLRAAYAAP